MRLPISSLNCADWAPYLFCLSNFKWWRLKIRLFKIVLGLGLVDFIKTKGITRLWYMDIYMVETGWLNDWCVMNVLWIYAAALFLSNMATTTMIATTTMTPMTAPTMGPTDDAGASVGMLVPHNSAKSVGEGGGSDDHSTRGCAIDNQRLSTGRD